MLALAGGTGGLTLAKINEYGSLVCWILGSVAAICTIHSWWEKRKKRKSKEQSGK